MTELTNQPNQSFFGVGNVESKKEEKENNNVKNNINESQFTGKGANRQLNEHYDISFTIGSAVFGNILSFENEIRCDAVILFRKKEVLIIVIDVSKTYASVVKIERTEFSDYHNNLKDENDEKAIFIDLSIIVDKLSINENYPINFYIDYTKLNRYYIICGKELVQKQLNVMKDDDGILKGHKSFENVMNGFLSNKDYQKIVINSTPFMSLLKSLGKKADKGKDKNTYCDLSLNKNKLDFRILNDVWSSSLELSGEDLLVYPINEENVEFDLKLLNKFGLLKQTFTTNLYSHGDKLPLILESRLGGGKIVVYYLIAPRAK